MLLQRAGYDVTCALGNQKAMELAKKGDFNLAVVGHSTSLAARVEMLQWLAEHWPGLPVVALRRHPAEVLPAATYVADVDDPGQWLAAVAKAAA